MFQDDKCELPPKPPDIPDENFVSQSSEPNFQNSNLYSNNNNNNNCNVGQNSIETSSTDQILQLEYFNYAKDLFRHVWESLQNFRLLLLLLLSS